MDAADATTALTAAINGYAMSSDEAMGIVDKLTQLDLEFAASSGDIATAMSKVASVSAQGGVSLEKLMAILTVTEDQTQQSADTIGNAWNSIFQRMSKISAGKDVSDTGASLKCLGHIRIIHNLIMKILSNYLETLIRQTTRAKNIFIHAERLTERIPFRYGNVIV